MVMGIARTAPSTARRCGTRPVLIIIILVEYLIPMQCSDGQEVATFVLAAACLLNIYPEIIAIVPREMLTGAFNLPRAGCLHIWAIDLITEFLGVVPSPIVHLVAGFVKHLPHKWAEGSPALPNRRTPAPAVRPYQLEFWKVAGRDWIKKDYIIQEVPCPLVLNTANIVYQYDVTDVFRDESLHTVPIQWQVSIYNWCRHLCPILPLSLRAALWCHRCVLNMNLHPKR